MQVPEQKDEQTEDEDAAGKVFFVVCFHHDFVRGTACRSRLRGHDCGGAPRRKVFGKNTAG